MNDDEEIIVKRGRRRGDFGFSERAGVMSRQGCPDCHRRLTPIVKVLREDENDGHAICSKRAMAAICENRECWRYTDPYSLRSWRKAV